MKKLIAALVLATSFAAFADDAAKPADAKKTEKKAAEPKKDAAAKDAKPAAEKAPEKK
jgi:Ni/Co efflux regulator RcnB